MVAKRACSPLVYLFFPQGIPMDGSSALPCFTAVIQSMGAVCFGVWASRVHYDDVFAADHLCLCICWVDNAEGKTPGTPAVSDPFLFCVHASGHGARTVSLSVRTTICQLDEICKTLNFHGGIAVSDPPIYFYSLPRLPVLADRQCILLKEQISNPL